MNALISLVLAAALILGGGATAVAAQDDLPNELLYPLKLWTENARLSLAGDPQDQANLLMNMAQTRVEEIAALAEEGVVPPAQVQQRLELQLEQTLQLASGMDDAAMTQTLAHLHERLQTQDRLMAQLQTHVNADIEPLLTRTREMLQTRLRLVEEGLTDPQGFRNMMTNQMRYGQEEEVAPEPNQEQNGQAERPGAGNENQTQNQNGQDVDAPGDQTQNQNQDQNQEQNQNQNQNQYQDQNQDQNQNQNQEQYNSSNGPGDGAPGGNQQNDSDDDSADDGGGQGNDDAGSGGSSDNDSGEGGGGGGSDSGGGGNGGGGTDSGGSGGGGKN